MRHLGILLTSLLMTHSIAYAGPLKPNEYKRPLEPVYAADQRVISTDSVELEIEQFRFIARYHQVQDQLREAELKRDQAKKDFERDSKLFDQGSISETKFLNSQLQYQTSERAVLQLTSRVDEQKSLATISGLKLLEKGNPGSDHRGEIFATMQTRLDFEKRNLIESKNMARLNLDFFSMRYENGQKLHRKGVISDMQLEQRELELQNAKDQLQSVEYQIIAVQDAMAGLKKSQDRI
ncbi:MAG TPA: hypothetical protein PKC28_04910 [Bdellovibrionales bacterium]|nr:hypothetical protein [Bdellovibrionales bacterium]